MNFLEQPHVMQVFQSYELKVIQVQLRKECYEVESGSHDNSHY